MNTTPGRHRIGDGRDHGQAVSVPTSEATIHTSPHPAYATVARFKGYDDAALEAAVRAKYPALDPAVRITLEVGDDLPTSCVDVWPNLLVASLKKD